MKVQIYIEGENGEAAAQALTEQLPSAQLQSSGTTRSIDWAGVIDIIKDAGDIIGAVGGTVSLAHTIWQWRREKAKAAKILLQKEQEGKRSRIILDHEVTEEDIRQFLNS